MRLVIEADGGSRGNPGPAGYGAVVRDAVSGEVLAEAAESLGTVTNNVAEYRGLIAGLTKAAEIAPDADVEARMDSKLVVEQMSGRWRIKHPDMKPLALEARDLASGFSSIRFTWIPRERNKHADRLANEAMDAAAKGRTWSASDSSASLAADDEEPHPAPAPSSSSTGWAAPSGVPTTTVLLRHGETPLSADKRFAGVGEIPLTETGVMQARAAAKALAGRSFDAIVSSPLGRTRQTAQEVADVLGLAVRTEDGLRETDFGDWEGYSFAEVRERWPAELDAWLADPSVAPPHGESFTATARRVQTARDKLLVRFRQQTILVVSHVTPIKMLVRSALEAPPSALYRMYLEVSSISEIDWYADGPAVLKLFNDTHHLA
ncbi:bifunctional RNase H/acid phosphatase [Actinomadura sp. DC4]|uniref:bifunctional RNase H/acid phosphatase n=1 Tax=Actinomadura sp. DC4 TaxID=3055069 RepID=UPI0025AF05BB|nr:bifunctional RNase H/acid phosphatase [Actinomadura sp. DC4]MDN3354998.1 bifunctional RNase H/acid phosphatase [Actinomadura sp. DC4]